MKPMSRQERRAAMPECAAFIDDMREHFPDLIVLHAEENGQAWGEPQRVGVQVTEQFEA